jgi:3D (Asp-Asp-Asp) domain-containing protein
MHAVDNNLDGDAHLNAVAATARRRRSRAVAASAFLLSTGLMALGISTGRTAMSSATPAVANGALPDSPVLAPVLSLTSRPSPTDSSRLLQPAPRSTQADRDRIRAGLVGVREFNGRPVRAVDTIRMRVTAYSPDERSCGASADGITASGYSVFTNGGALVAADPRVLPLGSLVSIAGYEGGAVVPVLDVGGAIKGNRLDVLHATHEVAMQWGVRDLEVTVWEYADGLPNGFKRLRRPSK